MRSPLTLEVDEAMAEAMEVITMVIMRSAHMEEEGPQMAKMLAAQVPLPPVLLHPIQNQHPRPP